MKQKQITITLTEEILKHMKEYPNSGVQIMVDVTNEELLNKMKDDYDIINTNFWK